jgi:hypothetical protein
MSAPCTVLLVLAWLSASPSSGPGGGEAAALRFGRDVRPILADRCFTCHGPDAAKRRARLRLDTFEGATADRDGYQAIAPGDPGASELLVRVSSSDPEEQMPPPGSNKKPLTEAERETLRRWIEGGAAYEEHWAFTRPARPPLPEVGEPDGIRTPVDRFVLARLEAEGLSPAPEAAPDVLLRRLFLTVTGLPPTPEERAAYLADTRPDRYELQLERLFTEEPYRSRHAERMAAPWLDLARYADTIGLHTDAGRQMWAWRDWVLGAYRDGMPYDRFLTEQLAGDLLPDATTAQRVASGFNRNHVMTDEGGAIPAEYLVEYAVDRASTTAGVFLGLTMGCARCHEHKFDPISQQEFYRFYSFFNSIEEPGLYSQQPDPRRSFEPFLQVPSPDQERMRDELLAFLERERVEVEVAPPGEEAQREAWFAERRATLGLTWEPTRVLSAHSDGGAQLAPQPDGSVLARGANPDRDVHTIRIVTEGTDLSVLALEALGDPSLFEGRVGRAPNGNAVLQRISAEAYSLADPSVRRTLHLEWAWADVEQPNGDYAVVNALTDNELGWAVDAHRQPGGRLALFLADEPFGWEGGTEIVVRLDYTSVYAQHVFGRVRLALARLGEGGRERLGLAFGRWLQAGPFETDGRPAGYEIDFGPERDLALARDRVFEPGAVRWRFVEAFADGRLNTLEPGVNVHYLGRELFAPSARTWKVSLGTDDGYRLFLDGVPVGERRVDRALAADQDEVEIALERGRHTLVLEVVNTGGQAGFYWSPLRDAEELSGDLVLGLAPPRALSALRTTRLQRAWRLAFSPDYRERTERIAAREAELSELEAAIPRTMVMSEMAEPRTTFVLKRGQYDHPDPEQPVERGVPRALGALPEGAPQNRLGLAQWMCSPANPLTARVAANRLWELVFGTGLVRTSGDFGAQGEWPSHPELLDWLAVELVESGWDQRHLLRLILSSATFRQDARGASAVLERDPENRLLAHFPRGRLPAEALRDQALYVSGLLVERLGGPSVKPYQPEGLWREVAMVQSNTRIFERGEGQDLWRRSLYTYWKRACPPPAMTTLDAPGREFSCIRRVTTNTPLQALVLWNDEQFVEAARVLAERTLGEADEDGARLERLHLRCTGREPGEDELALLAEALAAFRARYADDPDAAAALLAVGEAPLPEDLPAAELAAWTLIASAVLNLDASLNRG